MNVIFGQEQSHSRLAVVKPRPHWRL